MPAYRAILRRFAARRRRLAARYRRAPTRAARAARLAEARELLLTALDSTIFPAWEGTPWAFYGTSWEPRRGRIACGYFVTTSLHDAGLRTSRVVEGDWTPASGYRAGQEVLARGDATGVVVANDHMALGLLRALAAAGRAVPGDVSVVGFDDTAEAAHLQPPLTSVRQDFAEVGARSVATLLALIETGQHDGDPQLVPTELVVRESSGPPPA